jgi:hypothetical protein
MLLHWIPGDVDATFVFPCYNHPYTFPNYYTLTDANSRFDVSIPYRYPPFNLDVYTHSHCYTFHPTLGNTYAILSTHPNGHRHPKPYFDHHILTISYKLSHSAHADTQREYHAATLTNAKQHSGNPHTTITSPIKRKL